MRGWAVCPSCADAVGSPSRQVTPAGLDWCGSWLAYQPPVPALVGALKFSNNRAALRWLARGMAATVASGSTPRLDSVTWAPTSAERRRRRGYDQAELLARAVGAELRLPVRRRLSRRAGGPPQTGLGRADRLDHPGFFASPAGDTAVLVVDDVVTTGATLSAAALALRAAGTRWVGGITAAAALDSTARRIDVGRSYHVTAGSPAT